MSEPNQEEQREDEGPEIIVDEDWKDQIQAEKEKLHDTDSEGPQGGHADHAEIPDASFPMLVTTLATQATVALGQHMAPDATEVTVDLGLAKHIIDTLGILQEKTKGNLTGDEDGMLTNVLHQLRMIFVSIQSQMAEQPEKKSSIELP